MKISVLTPSYNSEKFIESAIKSVLIQNDHNFEHIIVDGCSSDRTVEIIKEYPHIKYISERDNGQSDAMNKAYKLSTGDVLVYLNADDVFLEGAFKNVREAFDSFPGIQIVVGKLDIYKDGKLVQTSDPEIEISKILFPFKYQFPFNPVSYFYRVNVQKKIGGFPVGNHFAMDYWFLLEALGNFKTTKINSTLGIFNNDDANKTSNTLKDHCFWIGLRYCLKTKTRFLGVFLYRYINHYWLVFRQSKKQFFRVWFYNLFLSKHFSVIQFRKYGIKTIIRSIFIKKTLE